MTISPAELAHRALDAAPDAMLLVDDSGVIRFANRQVVALFGYLPEGVIGKSMGQLVPQCCRGGSNAHGEKGVDERGVWPIRAEGNLIGRREDGTEFPLEMTFSPIGDADGTHVAVIRNVTERTRVEIAIVAAREDADRANLGKSRFLATASHDLRQPVQTLALLNGILRRTVVEPGATDALDQQEQAIGAMSRLLNALLDISKLESGVIKPEQTDFAVAVVFNELRREFASLAESKGLTLHAEECVDFVHSDPSLVEQILRNLVANAIKYTRQGCIRLRCLHEQALVRIEVLDTGVGIPADQLRYIFDEFYQVGVATNASRDGFGLGLSIVQRLVRLLNLRLEVRSEVGKGSAFSLELPSGVPQAASPCVDVQRRAAPEPRTDRPRVLLVEDDSAVREATRMLLNVEGYRVSAVCSLEEALQHARQKGGVDLLVTDYHLSEGEKGTQVIAALRERLGASLKAVLITGDTSCAIKELPRDPHLRVTSKPVKAEELLALLRELLAA
ncbi:ATP-binding protein [Metallibacterium sp.]|uniref:PAS domain-containing hybrid sensor histidine kinase/response regulator n=1 Tax=Metallibacterium sp. TaxID=2940281 RepID=UPI00262DDF16|nr:ATP-binding protein [Metallibacterium sp.]